MIRHLLHVNFDGQRGLQEQVRESLINAILSGIFQADTLFPHVANSLVSLMFLAIPRRWYLKVWSMKGIWSAAHAAGITCTRITTMPVKTCRNLHLNAKALHHDGATACKSRPASRSLFSNPLAGCTIATRLFTASRTRNNFPSPSARCGKLAARRRT
jgi:hypothetical protein